MVRALAILALILAAAPAGAACRLALALAFDVSKSVSITDYAIQQKGIVAALQDSAVRDAFLKPQARVALAIFEWSGRDHQEVLLDWTMMESAADLDRVTALIAAHQRAADRQPTALGRALIFAQHLLGDAPDCDGQTLDVSGDGRNNDGYAPRDVFADWNFTGVTVNGLAIGGHESDILEYYAGEVMHGAGAFVMVAHRHEDFPGAFKRKLMRELTDALLGGGPGQRGPRPGRARRPVLRCVARAAPVAARARVRVAIRVPCDRAAP